MLKKSASLLLVLLLFCTSAIGFCASSKVHITFWDENAGPNRTPFLQEMIKNFNQANPEIEVEYVGLPWSSSKQKLDVSIAANNPPDCSGMVTNWVSEFALNGAIIPLDSYFNKLKDRKQFTPVHIQGLRGLVPNKKLYELPNTFNANLMWYRPDWFKEAGIAPPKTWDELFTAVSKLTDKSKNRYGLSIRGGSGSTIATESLMYGYSGITDYFTKKGKCTVNDPLHREFLKKYVGLYRTCTPESDITNGYKEMVGNYDNGIAALIAHNIGSFGEHDKTLGPGKFAPLAFPIGKKGKRVAMTTINGYAIYKASKHPKEAWKFISYMCSAQSQSYWNKTIGQLPTRMDVLKEPWVNEREHLKLMGQVFSEKTSVSMKRPNYLPDYASIHLKLEPKFQEVLMGKLSSDKFLDEWASAMEKAKADYDKIFQVKK